MTRNRFSEWPIFVIVPILRQSSSSLTVATLATLEIHNIHIERFGLLAIGNDMRSSAALADELGGYLIEHPDIVPRDRFGVGQTPLAEDDVRPRKAATTAP